MTNAKHRHQAREVALQVLYHCDLSGLLGDRDEQRKSSPTPSSTPSPISPIKPIARPLSETSLTETAQQTSKQIAAMTSASSPAIDDQSIDEHFDHFKVPPNLRPYAKDLILGTLTKLGSIDQMIEAESANWKMSRMPPIDRNLLRMTAYELIAHEDVPISVAIDEAVELAKSFGSADSFAFINGILDTLAKKIRQIPAPSVE